MTSVRACVELIALHMTLSSWQEWTWSIGESLLLRCRSSIRLSLWSAQHCGCNTSAQDS